MPSPRAKPGRLVFDLSSMLRWSGPPVGIVRVERELYAWSRRLDDVTYVVMDPADLSYRVIPTATLDAYAGNMTLDMLGNPDPSRRKRHGIDKVPAALKPAALWLFQFRHRALQALERRRLRAFSAATAQRLDNMQRRLMSSKYRVIMLNRDGSRRAFMPWDMVRGNVCELGPDDTLLCTGTPWSHGNIEAIAKLKAERGFRLVLLCYDIIPIQFPQFYKPHDASAFKAYYDRAFQAADLVVFNSHRVADDARAYCAANGFSLGDTAVVPLGADPINVKAGPAQALPEGLSTGHYALFVSTIEPRKGHRLLYQVWLRLLQEGVPQRTGFKLVFVGRPGWMVDDLIDALRHDRRIAGSLVMLPSVSDESLAALYAGAAFCLYPSLYEGYGLPIAEAFFRGKAVLASNGGALPEVVRDFSPCLDPRDEDAWYRTLRRWIEDPSERLAFEQAIRARYSHPTWTEAAAQFFALLNRTGTTPAASHAAAN